MTLSVKAPKPASAALSCSAAITDLHGHPFDCHADRPLDTVGLARTPAQISDVQGESATSRLLANGNFLQGNPMCDDIASKPGMNDRDTRPVITAMNTIGFNASTLGNHPFNNDISLLMKSGAGAASALVAPMWSPK